MGNRNTCCLCKAPIDPVIDLRDEDGNHYHRACNLTAASTLYRYALARIAELEELVVRVEQQRNTMTAERDELESLLVESRECQKKVSP